MILTDTVHAAGSGNEANTEVTELQEMMYDRESGCLVFEQTLLATASGAARQLQAWHTQLVFSPAGSGGSTVHFSPLCLNKAVVLLRTHFGAPKRF